MALIRRKLNLRGGLRAVGDRSARVRRVMLHPGVNDTGNHVAALFGGGPACRRRSAGMGEHPLCGRHLHSWRETWPGDYRPRCIRRSGMRACADWLKTVVREVPARWIALGDPYWRSV